jgi:hypothetical protein
MSSNQKELLTQLKTIGYVYIGLSGEPKPDTFSWLIQLFLTILKWVRTGRWEPVNFSHGASGYYSIDCDEFVFADASSSVQLDTVDQFLDDGKTVIRHAWAVEVTPEQRTAFCKRMVELNGWKYSNKRSLAWLVFAAFLDIEWTPFSNKKRMWCNQYPDEMLNAVELPSTAQILDLKKHQTTPLDLFKAMEVLSMSSDRVRKVL